MIVASRWPPARGVAAIGRRKRRAPGTGFENFQLRQIGLETADDQADQIKAEFRILEIELFKLFIGDGEQVRVPAAKSGGGSMAFNGEHRHFAEQRPFRPLARHALPHGFAARRGGRLYRGRRLHRAFFDLAATTSKGPRVSEVARRWNLGSEANFSRAFKAANGVSPKAACAAALLSEPEPWRIRRRQWRVAPDALDARHCASGLNRQVRQPFYPLMRFSKSSSVRRALISAPSSRSLARSRLARCRSRIFSSIESRAIRR